MKKAADETKQIKVHIHTHALLGEACKADVGRPTLGQMITRLAYEKFGHLAKGEAPANPEAIEMARELWAKNNGNKIHAMADIPIGHPWKIELVKAIQKLSQGGSV